ncbi:hypothetical protein KDL29_10270 [bacterium]|nr:hypothetical protein [bacterium]
MAIYKLLQNEIVPMERTTFGLQGIRERQDLQNLLKQQIEIIAPDVLVVAEEFADWEDSKRRIDLLGIDKEANLVVIELKRTEDGGHMELQAIRYAAMISTLTFEKLVAIYSRYLEDIGSTDDASDNLLGFLEWSEPDEDQFAQKVRIILASAEFSRELTTSVMWLIDFGIDIRCVRMHPYVHDGETFLDVQTVIPLPEVADYQVRIREKKQKEREAREGTRDTTRFNLVISGTRMDGQSKRWVMFHVISALIRNGIHPDEIVETIREFKKRPFEVFEGTLGEEAVYDAFSKMDSSAKLHLAKRFFSEESQLFHVDNRTYVLTNQWGLRSFQSATALSKRYADMQIRLEPVDD